MAVAAVGVLLLTGCGRLDASDHPERSAEHGRQVEAEMPALVRAAGWDSVGTLTERSCLGIADPEEASRKTRWSGSSGAVGVDRTEAERVIRQVRKAAEDRGWTPRQTVDLAPNQEHLYSASQDDLSLVVTYATGSGRPRLDVSMSSPCLDMPAGHTMTRSELDPMYGSSDPLYPNDDRSTFTNGEPQPLPGGSS